MTSPIKAAMVLAAGRGERLRPLTDRIPKPLLPIGDEPLLVHHLKRLAQADIQRVVINLGWLGEQIPTALASHLATSPLNQLEVIFSQEPPGALETAGGIRHALHHFEDQPFLLLSGDVLTNYALTALAEHPLKGSAHLVLVDNPSHHPSGDFVLTAEQWVEPADPLERCNTLTYSGMGLFSPDLFKPLSPGHRALRPVLDQAIAQKQITGEHHTGAWLDIGTIERYEAAQQRPTPP